MATFVKGDWVEVQHRADYRWEHWSGAHTDMCGKTGQITNVDINKWTNDISIEVDHRGKRLWFLPDHLIKVENYNQVFDEAVADACEKLQQHESLCKRLRDEILEGYFGEDKPEENTKEILSTEEEDSIFEDWHEVTTKEVIPLPGNGGTMTDPYDTPKSSANTHRKKVRTKRSKVAKKAAGKKKSIKDDWDITEEELEELQEYMDNLPYSGTPSNDVDYDYLYEGDEDDTDWFT